MTEKDFDKCKCNPLLDDFYIDNDALKELGGHQQMMWVVMVYDPNTPLLKKCQDLDARIKYAEELSGYTSDGKESDAIIGYLKIVNSRLWASRCAIETALWEQMKIIITPISEVGAGQDKDRLAAVNMKNSTATSIIELNDMLDALDAKFEMAPAIEKSKETEPAAKKKPVTAEQVAKQMAQ